MAAPETAPGGPPAPAEGQTSPFEYSDHALLTEHSYWQNLYKGLEGIDDRVSPSQQSALKSLDGVNPQGSEARAKAVNQAYLREQMPKLDVRALSNNWETVKRAYAKNRLGVDKDVLSDGELYGMIGKAIGADKAGAGEDSAWQRLWHIVTTPKLAGSLISAVHTVGATPMEKLPEAPTNLPNLPELGAMNPALLGFAWNINKPGIESLTSPENIALMRTAPLLGAAAEVSTAAKAAFVSMNGVFSALMGYSAAKSAPQTIRVLKDPKASLEDKGKALMNSATPAVMSLLGALGTFHALAGKDAKAVTDVEDAPKGMLEAAQQAKNPDDQAALVDSAQQTSDVTGNPKLPAPKPEPEPAAEQPPSETTPKPQAKPITPEPARNLVGIKNEAVDAELKAMGLEPAEHGPSVNFEALAQEASQKLRDDPLAGNRLVEELRDKPRAVSPQEAILVEAEGRRIANERDAAEDELTEAKKAKDPAKVAEVEMRISGLRDRFAQQQRVATLMGTPQAQGLAIRRMMMREDYSLASMENQLAAETKDGKITPEQEKEIKGLSRHIRETAGEVEKHEVAKVKKRTDNIQKMRQGALKNQIEDMDRQIQAGERETKRIKRTEPNEETLRLKELRDSLKAAYDVMFPGKPDVELTPEQELNRALSAKDSQIQELERQIEQREPFPAGKKPPPTDPRLVEKQKRIDALKEEREYLRQSLNPEYRGSDRELRLKQYKQRIARDTEVLLAKLARGDTSPKPKPEPIKLDREGEILKAAHERAKQQFDRMVLEERLKNRSFFERGANTLLKWRRGFILSSPITLLKLSAAAALRTASTYAEEAVGTVLSKTPGVSKVAAKAERYGAINSRAEAQALTSAFTDGIRDAWNVLRTGKSDLDVIHAKGTEAATGEKDLIPASVMDFFGRLHGAIKAPVKRMEFTRSFQKRAEAVIRGGGDATNPMVQARIAVEAYKDANRAIFLQDNRLITVYKRAMSAFSDKAEGQEPGAAARIAETGIRVAFPIVKVPTNIVAETFESMTGLGTGSFELARALRGGIDNLTPAKADLIMRHLQKGSLGGAALLLGYFGYKHLGGHYQERQKPAKGAPNFGDAKIFGQDIPGYLMHHPLIEAAQIGATIHWVQDSKLHKKDKEAAGIGEGLWAGALGLAEDVPFTGDTQRFLELLDPQERAWARGELAKGILVPQGLQALATMGDKDAHGNPVKRKPATVLQHIETAIPGLREKVPSDKKTRTVDLPSIPRTPRERISP